MAAALRPGFTAMSEMQLYRDCLVSCRGLFATHYHRLADAHEQDTKVAICHMGCNVEPGTNGCPEQVTTHNMLWAQMVPGCKPCNSFDSTPVQILQERYSAVLLLHCRFCALKYISNVPASTMHSVVPCVRLQAAQQVFCSCR